MRLVVSFVLRLNQRNKVFRFQLIKPYFFGSTLVDPVNPDINLITLLIESGKYYRIMRYTDDFVQLFNCSIVQLSAVAD